MSKSIEDYYNIKKTQKEDMSISKDNVHDTENFNPQCVKEEEEMEENSEFTDQMLHEIISSLDENSNSFLSRRSVASIYTEKNYLYDEEDIDMKKQNEQKEMEGNGRIDNNNINEEEVEEEEEERSSSSFRKRIIQMNQGLNDKVLNSGYNVGSNECYEKESKEADSKEVSPRQLQEEIVFPEEDKQFIHKAGTIREICDTLKEEVVEAEELSEGERKWEKQRNSDKKQFLKTDRKWTAQNVRRRHSMKRSGVTNRNEDARKVHSFRITEDISKEKNEFFKYSRNGEELEVLKEKDKMKEKVQNSESKIQKEIKYIYKSYSPAPIPQTEKTGFWFIDTINSLLDRYCDINEKDHYLNNMDIIEIYPNDEAQYIRINDTLKIKWPDFLKWDYIIYHTHILKIYEKIFKKFHKDVKSVNSLTQSNQERLNKPKEIPLPKFFHKNVKDRCILKCYEHLPELKIMENQCNSLYDNKEKKFRNVWKNSANRVEKTFAFFFDKFSEKIINMGNNINVVDSLKEGTKSVVSNVQNSDIFSRFPKVLNSFFENMFSCLKYEKGDEEEIEVVMDNFPMESSMANSDVCPYYDNMNFGTPHKSNVSNFVNAKKIKYSSHCDSNILGLRYNSFSNNNYYHSNTTVQTSNFISNELPTRPVHAATLLYNDMRTNSMPRKSGTFNSMDYLVPNTLQKNAFGSSKKYIKTRAYNFDELPKYTRSYANSRSKISSSFHSLDNDNADFHLKNTIYINSQCEKTMDHNGESLFSKMRRNHTEDIMHPSKFSLSNFTEPSVKSSIPDNFHTINSLPLEKGKWDTPMYSQNGMNIDNQELFLECKSNITPHYVQ